MSWNLVCVKPWFGPNVISTVSLIFLIISCVVYGWVISIFLGTVINFAFSPPSFTTVYLISASDSFFVETSLNVCTKLSLLSISFFNLSNNIKLAGFNTRDDTSWLFPGLTNAIYGVTFSFKL